MLDADRRETAPPRFDHDRASPAAGFRIRDDRRRLETIERGTSFVHRASRPRELQARDPGAAFEITTDLSGGPSDPYVTSSSGSVFMEIDPASVEP